MSDGNKLDLVRGLGRWSSAAIVVGTMVGTGIFLKPAEMAADAGSLFIAEAGGAFAGFAACWVRQEDALAETEESNRYGYISDTFVMPALRGRGIAGHLIRAAEVHLRATGVTRLRIGVLAANRSAQRAYSKSGFEPYELTLEKRLTIKGGPDFRN